MIDLKISYSGDEIKIDASKSDGQEIRVSKNVKEFISMETQILVTIQQVLKKLKVD